MAHEIYAQLKQDFRNGKATEISFSGRKFDYRVRNGLIDLANADGLYLYMVKGNGYGMKNCWLEKKENDSK